MSTTPPENDPTPEPDETAETAKVTSGDPPRRLTRSRSDRILAGVAGGVAKYFNVDPVIVRIVAVVLVFFGGAGLLLYLAGLLLMPNEGEAGSTAPDRNRGLVIVGVILLICLAGPFLFVPAFGLAFPLAFLLLAGLATAWLVTGRWPEYEAGPILRATLLGLGVLALLFVVALASGWGAAAGGGAVVAGLVIAAGVALVAGAFVKPVRWLIPLALALALPAGFVSAAGIDLDGGYGEKSYRPGTVADIREHYELGAGELTVDLRGLDLPAGDREIELDLGMGHAQVLVDEGVCVATRADVGMGAVDVFDEEDGGIDVDVDDLPRAVAGTPRVVLDADVGLGLVEVSHVDDGRDFGHWRDRGPGRDRDDFDSRGNEACA
jgi:phage shock protein PspC (stress-responsive transcriptional regulator)